MKNKSLGDNNSQTLLFFKKMKNLLLLFAFIVLPIASICQQYSFIIDTITNDTLFDISLNNSIAVDDSNNVHIVWRKSLFSYPAQRSIYYSKRSCTTGNWSIALLISDTTMESEAQSIAVDKNTGTVHIVFISYEFENPSKSKIIHVSICSNQNWTIETVKEDSLEQGYEYPYMAVDVNNFVHIMWAGYTSSGLKRIYYSTNISGNWETQILPDNSYNYLLCDDCVRSITVTSNGIAYIAFLAMPNPYQSLVRIAHNDIPNGKNWYYEIIDTPGLKNSLSLISIKSDSLLHLIITSQDSGIYSAMCYYGCKEINSSWNNFEYINNKVVRAMEIDSYEKVHLMQSYSPLGIYYTTNVSGVWNDTIAPGYSIVPSGEIFGGSIGLTKQNKPCFVTNLKYGEYDEVIVIRTSDHCDTTNSISTPEIITNQVVVFPNPMNNSSLIKFNNLNQEEYELKLFDFFGQVVRTIKCISNGEIVINKRNLNSGIYFFHLSNNFKVHYSGKLLIN